MTAGSVVFLFVVVLAAGFFALNVQRLVSYLRLGYAEDRTDHPLTRLRERARRSASRRRRSSAIRSPARCTRSIFWGFMVLTAGTVEILDRRACSRGSRSRCFLPRAALPRSTRCRRTCSRVLVLGAVGVRALPPARVQPKRLQGDKLEHTRRAVHPRDDRGAHGHAAARPPRSSCVVDPAAHRRRRRSSRGRSAMIARRVSAPARRRTRRRASSGGRTRC